MRHRLERHNRFGLRLLSLIETLDLGTKPDREVGRLDKRPAEILVPVLGVAAAFALAVADLLTAHTPAIRGEVPYTGKSPDIAGLQHDRQRQDLSDPRYGFKKPEFLSQFHPLDDGLF